MTFAALVMTTGGCQVVDAMAIGSGSSSAEVDGWLRWRGPMQNGTSFEIGLPDTIDAADAAWTYDKRGRGTPVIANGRVYSMSYEGEGPDLQEIFACLDERTGRVLWEHRFSDFMSEIIYDRYALTAPTVDPETGNIFIMTTPGLLCCYSPNGELQWQQPMMEKFGRFTYPNGRTLAPLVDDDRIIVHTMTSNWGPDGPARDRFFAFDKDSGDHVWTSMPCGPPKDSPYSHPVFEWRDGQRLLYAGTAGGNMVCVNALTGQPVWRFQMSIGGVCASPVLYGDQLIAVHGKENLDASNAGRMIAINLGAGPNDDGSQRVLDYSHEKWRNDDVTSFTSSPVLVDNRVYVTVFTGELVCLDADTGKEVWREKLASDQIHASPMYADGKLYVPMNDGSFHVLRPSDSGAEILSTTQLEGNCLGAPAVWNGRIYVHTTEKLYCFGGGSGSMSGQPSAQIAPAAGPATALQIMPAEILVRPGEPVSFTARSIDANGIVVDDSITSLNWNDNTLGVNFSGNGMTADTSGASPGAGVLVASSAGVSGKVRFRVVYPHEFTEDFESIALTTPDPADASVKWGRPPGFWMGGFPKWDVREVDGSKVLAKTIANPLFMRTLTYFGDPYASNYTMQADVMTDGNRRLMSGAGIVNQRYLVHLKGNSRVLQIQSNDFRFDHTVPFRVTPGTWYTLKSRVDIDADGAATIYAKAWPRDEPEPAEWTTQYTHAHGHATGSPGVYALSPQSRFRVYMDNIIVTPND